jgi:hypothetical protein
VCGHDVDLSFDCSTWTISMDIGLNNCSSGGVVTCDPLDITNFNCCIGGLDGSSCVGGPTPPDVEICVTRITECP